MSQTIPKAILTPATMIGGQRSCIASDHQAHTRAEYRIKNQLFDRDLALYDKRTCDNLYSLYAKRISVDLPDRVHLVIGGIEAL